MDKKVAMSRNINKKNAYGVIGKIRESKDKVIRKIRRENTKEMNR